MLIQSSGWCYSAAGSSMALAAIGMLGFGFRCRRARDTAQLAKSHGIACTRRQARDNRCSCAPGDGRRVRRQRGVMRLRTRNPVIPLCGAPSVQAIRTGGHLPYLSVKAWAGGSSLDHIERSCARHPLPLYARSIGAGWQDWSAVRKAGRQSP